MQQQLQEEEQHNINNRTYNIKQTIPPVEGDVRWRGRDNKLSASPSHLCLKSYQRWEVIIATLNIFRTSVGMESGSL